MLDLKMIIDNTEKVQEMMRLRHVNVDLREIVELDKKRRDIILKVEGLKQERNEKSKLVGKIKKEGGDPKEIIDSVGGIGEQIKAWDAEQKSVEDELKARVEVLPNIFHESTPRSLNKEDNVVIKTVGKKPEFDFKFKNHIELAQNLGLVDFEAGSRVAGHNFVVYRGIGAQLEWALVSWMMHMNSVEGPYELIMHPSLINRESFYASGQLPKFEEQAYKCKDDELYLIPTSESILLALQRDQMLSEENLPIYYTAYSQCFRREAGTYGADERGLIRLHQFNKVELFKFVHPDTSYDELEKMLLDSERLISALGLHYQVSLLVSGDLGQQATKTYDIEVWLPGQNGYKEISSVSNCEDYQGRRGNIRFREKESKKVRFVHTLNGSALATPRLMVALLEQNQQADGSVVIPEVIRPYLNGLERISPK
jgi:seryl-tRNA synthetase